MKRIDILFFYEHIVRELDVACIIKHRVEAQHGLTCEIAHQYLGVADALKKWKPRLVVLPFCYSESIRHFPFLYDWRDALYFNMAWEELLYPGNREAKLPRGEFETRHVLHHAWSDAFAELLAARGVTPAHIFVNGNPAYQLYDAPYNKFFAARETLAAAHGLDPHKRWIFFPENYNWAFYKEWRLKDFARDGVQTETMDKMVAFSRDSFSQAIEWCVQLAAQPDVQIILRPRPMTPLQEFKQAVTALYPEIPAALQIIKAQTVREWILASDVVISSYSTSLIEAAVAGKRAFMVEPLPIPDPLRSDWHALAPSLRTFDEFAQACLGETPRDTRLGEWARAQMMARGDSIANLADYFARLVCGELPRPARPPHRALLNTQENEIRAALRFTNERLQGQQKRLTARRQSATYQNDFISTQDLDTRVAQWAKLLNSKPSGNGATH